MKLCIDLSFPFIDCVFGVKSENSMPSPNPEHFFRFSPQVLYFYI